jgi:dynein heavy chain
MSREYEAFKGLDTNFETNIDEWERVYNLQKPQSKKANWPAPFNELNIIRKTMLLRIFRPDKIIPMIQKLIKKEK